MLAGADLSNRRPLRAGSADGRVLIHHAGMTGAVSDHLFIGPFNLRHRADLCTLEGIGSGCFQGHFSRSSVHQ